MFSRLISNLLIRRAMLAPLIALLVGWSFLCVFPKAGAETTLVPETAWTGYFRHNAIGADLSGTPYIFSEGNLYKKTPSGWVYNSVLPAAGFYPSVLVDNLNTIHTFYHKHFTSNDYHLYHAECDPTLPNGASCSTAEDIVTNSSAYEFGHAIHNSVMEDIDGNLHLVYGFFSGYWGLFYTKRTGGIWSTPTRVHPGTPNEGYMLIDDVSLQLDADGRTLHAAFNNRSDFQVPFGLYYGTKAISGNWIVEPVIQDSFVWQLSLVLDGNTPRIVYSWQNTSTGQYELKLATRGSDGVWTHEVLFTNATGGIQSIDAENVNGTLHVIFSHGSGSSDDFRPVYVTKELPTGVPSSQRISDSGLTETAFVSMASDSSAIHISYNHNRDVLKYLRISLVTNQAPVANAGSDQTVDEGQQFVTLDGSASSDPEN
ncbi:secreted protein, partial [Candidatus Thiomargarita nelsonii]